MVPVIGPTLIWGGAGFLAVRPGTDQLGHFHGALGSVRHFSSVDNFVKPVLISRTAALPLLLIVVGVFGGVLSSVSSALFSAPPRWRWAGADPRMDGRTRMKNSPQIHQDD